MSICRSPYCRILTFTYYMTMTLSLFQHVWCYESLEARQAARETVWQHTQDQWQEIVARTVPLVRRMTSRVLQPLPNSPTQ